MLIAGYPSGVSLFIIWLNKLLKVLRQKIFYIFKYWDLWEDNALIESREWLLVFSQEKNLTQSKNFLNSSKFYEPRKLEQLML